MVGRVHTMFKPYNQCFYKRLSVPELCKCERQLKCYQTLSCVSCFYQMTMSSFNPFTWDSSSSLVKSHVLSLNIKDHEGKQLTVKDSKENIEIKIPRQVKIAPEESVSYFVKPSAEGKMQYHEMDLSRTRGNAIRLRVSMMACHRDRSVGWRYNY